MKLALKNGITGLVLRVKILDTSSMTGVGKTGLTSSSAGLVISTIADNQSAATAYTAAAGNIESVGTLGTYAAPSLGKCRFRQIDPSNHPGLYELQFADSCWAASDARSVIVTVSGVAGAAQVDAEIQLDNSAVTGALADSAALAAAASAANNVLTANIDTTGATAVTVTKALEAMLAVLCGTADFDPATGEELFRGRDGQTTIVTNAITGSGKRTQSTLH